MIGKRTRVLSRQFHMGGGCVHWFYVAERSGAILRALRAAKMGERQDAREWIKRVFDAHLDLYFPGFGVTVPRGRGLDNMMYEMWSGDERFVGCWDYETPIPRNHHWASRLESSRIQELADGVAEKVAGRNIVIVDDVFTTGSTLMTHLVALLRAGARATGLMLTVR